jgi:hypothetical protein
VKRNPFASTRRNEAWSRLCANPAAGWALIAERMAKEDWVEVCEVKSDIGEAPYQIVKPHQLSMFLSPAFIDLERKCN